MAFTIIPGSSSAPTTYEGTDGVDAAAIVSLPNESTGVDVFAKGADDVVNWGIQLVNSSIRGGDGNDLLTPNIINGATLIASFVNGNAGEDTLGGNIQLGISATITSVLGGQGNDVIYSNNLQSSRLNGNLGDDEIVVGFGIADDKLAIGATVNIANSQIFGGQGDDLIEITGGFGSVVKGYFSTVVDGNLGDDEIVVTLSGDTKFNNSIIAGGDGDDFINAEDTGEVDLVLDGGEGNDLILGGAGDDDIFAGEGDNIVDGGDGDDFITAGEGDDDIFGGFGDDTIEAGNGRNVVNGFEGDDVITTGEGEDTLFGGFGNDQIFGGADADQIFGGEDSDSLFGEEGDDYIEGEQGNDIISGGDNIDTIYGGEGNDVIDGDAGSDDLYGETGSDTINGGDGDDFIVGGSEADELTGGDGSNLFEQLAGSTGTAVFTNIGSGNLNNGDRFQFSSGPDVITDWTVSADFIDTGIFGNLATGLPGSLSYETAAVADTNYAVRGTFIAESDVFIVGANGGDGNDILVFTTGANATFSSPNITNFTVLAGAGGSSISSSNFV